MKTIGYDSKFPIYTYEEKILDGWNRYQAAKKAKVEPIIKEFRGTQEEALEFSIRANKDRRHLTSDQNACIAREATLFRSKIKEEIEKEQRRKQSENAVNRYTKDNLASDNKLAEAKKDYKPIRASDEIAKTFKTNRQYVSDVDKLAKENPDKYEKVKNGEIKLSEIKKEEKQIKLEQKKEEIKALEKKSIENKPKVSLTPAVQFLSNYKNNSIDCLMTDPPYSTDVKDINKFVEEWLPLALSKVKKDGRGYICIGAYPKEINAYLNVFLNQKKFILDNPLIWSYKNTLGITPKDKYNLNYQMILHFYSEESRKLDTSITNEMFSVQEINAPDGRLGNRFHTWQKPNELSDRWVRHSTKEKDLIVDCFCCTGTFLLSAAKQNRIAEGCDIEKKNLDIAIERGCELV
jgi:DNA modification methylase